MKDTGLILVLGSPNSDKGELYNIAIERCDLAFREYKMRKTCKILLTGGYGDHFNRSRSPHALYLKKYLKLKGIPENDFVEFAESSNTLEDASLSKPIVLKYKIKKLLIITSDYHIDRAKFVFEKESMNRLKLKKNNSTIKMTKTKNHSGNSKTEHHPHRQQSTGEEIANSITHSIGAALSIAALVLLVVFARKYGDTWRVISLSIYGSTLFMLYLASTLYHSFTKTRVKRFFRILDHSSIYLLIAGTYTPVTLVAMRGPWGWVIFGLIWAMAIGGIIAKIFLIGKFRLVSVFLYLAMGWLIVIALKPMLQMVPKGLIAWLFIGGLCYTFGIIFYSCKKVPYFHFIWHLFVLGGSISHFFGMLLHLASK